MCVWGGDLIVTHVFIIVYTSNKLLCVRDLKDESNTSGIIQRRWGFDMNRSIDTGSKFWEFNIDI